MALVHSSVVDARERLVAARLRNLLDQKTGPEKRTLRRYLLPLESRLVHSAPRPSPAPSPETPIGTGNDQT